MRGHTVTQVTASTYCMFAGGGRSVLVLRGVPHIDIDLCGCGLVHGSAPYSNVQIHGEINIIPHPLQPDSCIDMSSCG